MPVLSRGGDDVDDSTRCLSGYLEAGDLQACCALMCSRIFLFTQLATTRQNGTGDPTSGCVAVCACPPPGAVVSPIPPSTT